MTPTPSEKVLKHKGSLELLSKCKPKQRKANIETAEKEQIRAICECILNVLNENVPLPPHQLPKLRPYKKVLEDLADKRVGIKKKRKLLKLKGGFLPFVLGPILSVLGGLAGRAIGKAAGL